VDSIDIIYHWKIDISHPRESDCKKVNPTGARKTSNWGAPEDKLRGVKGRK
jgi:hypothetical protein